MIAPAYLAPTWRYAGDDWAGSNALTFTVYSTQPMVATDGTVSGGTLMNLTGFSVTGTILLRREGRALPAPTGAIVGDPSLGTISLSLDREYTQLRPQPFTDWGVVDNAMLLVRPRIVDPAGNIITQGLQPLFVF